MSSNKELKKRLRALIERPENQRCCECNDKHPTWATLIVPPPGCPENASAIGAFCCFQCVGAHRRLGVHICFVRSLTLDEWKESEVITMEMGGQKRVNDAFEAKIGSFDFLKPNSVADLESRERFIRAKYQDRSYFDPKRFPVRPVTNEAKTQKQKLTELRDRLGNEPIQATSQRGRATRRAPPSRQRSSSMADMRSAMFRGMSKVDLFSESKAELFISSSEPQHVESKHDLLESSKMNPFVSAAHLDLLESKPSLPAFDQFGIDSPQVSINESTLPIQQEDKLKEETKPLESPPKPPFGTPPKPLGTPPKPLETPRGSRRSVQKSVISQRSSMANRDTPEQLKSGFPEFTESTERKRSTSLSSKRSSSRSRRHRTSIDASEEQSKPPSSPRIPRKIRQNCSKTSSDTTSLDSPKGRRYSYKLPVPPSPSSRREKLPIPPSPSSRREKLPIPPSPSSRRDELRCSRRGRRRHESKSPTRLASTSEHRRTPMRRGSIDAASEDDSRKEGPPPAPPFWDDTFFQSPKAPRKSLDVGPDCLPRLLVSMPPCCDSPTESIPSRKGHRPSSKPPTAPCLDDLRSPKGRRSSLKSNLPPTPSRKGSRTLLEKGKERKSQQRTKSLDEGLEDYPCLKSRE